MNRRLLSTSLAVLCTFGAAYGQVFVSQVNGNDNNNGLSWNFPYKSLQRGIDEVALNYSDGYVLVDGFAFP